MNEKNAKNMLPETGLEGALFAMLDVETNKELRTNIEAGWHINMVPL